MSEADQRMPGSAAAALDRRPPRGRHDLPREFVARTQRDRLIDAMARTVAEKGAGGDVQDVHPVGSGRGDRDLSAVRRQPGELVGASKPYWATVSGDGRDCVISESGADRVSAISFATGRRVATVAVGDHPQRVRIGHVPTGWTAPAG